MWIRILLFTSIRIRILIQRAKPMQIHEDPDPGETLLSKVEFFMKNYFL
jgi:hypothetical protein